MSMVLGDNEKPLTERELQLVSRVFSDPTAFPVGYRAWLKGLIELEPPPQAVAGLDVYWEDVGTGASAGTAARLPIDLTTGNDLGPNIWNQPTYSEDYLTWDGMYQMQYPDAHFIIDPSFPNWITWPIEWADEGTNYAVYRVTIASELPYEPRDEPLDLTARKYWDFRCKWGLGNSGPGSVAGSGWSRMQQMGQEHASVFGSIRSDNTPAIPKVGTQYDAASDLTKSWQFCFQPGTGTGTRQGISFSLEQVHPGGAGDRQTANMYHTLFIERIY